jgi:hypothetical protein
LDRLQRAHVPALFPDAAAGVYTADLLDLLLQSTDPSDPRRHRHHDRAQRCPDSPHELDHGAVDPTCRHELFDRTLIWNQTHLLHALREYERHYHLRRPHRGISNARLLRPLPQPITNPATITHLRIRRHDRLGGLLHEYEHAA